MKPRLNSSIPIALAVSAALALSACSTPPTRAGQEIDPITLSSETVGPQTVGGDVLARLVETTSAGAVQVTDPKGASYSEDNEGDIIEALQAGTFDISVLRADRLATAGAASLGVLQTPFLVTTDAQAAKIAADPVADDLMADLDDIGLIGIALVPGGLRHPFGYNKALYGPNDYEGETINTRYGSGIEAILAALGATVDHSIDEREDKARSGELRGIEVSFQQQAAVDRPAVVTSNVVLYEKFDVVVVRSETWNGMTSAQQASLRSAAVAAGLSALAARDTEAKGLERWCSLSQAASVVATDEQLTQLKAALQPLIDANLSAPGAADIAKQLSELGAGTSAPAGISCGTLDADGSVASGSAVEDASEFQVTRQGPQDVLDGVWRIEADLQAMLDAGLSAGDAGANAGVWTLTIVDHIADVDQPNGPNCAADFAFAGDAVSIAWEVPGNDECYGHSIGTFRRDGDVVTFNWEKNQDYDVLLDQVMFADGMHKIG